MLYEKFLKKYNIAELSTKCVEFLEILNKLEFYGKRASFYLKPIYGILLILIDFLIKKELAKQTVPTVSK